MKFNYIFINQHNGHGDTYHPFSSNSVLTQEKITEWLMKVPGATRCGTTLNDLLSKLYEKEIEFEEFKCPCCGTTVSQLKNVFSLNWSTYGIEWIFLEGVSGNY